TKLALKELKKEHNTSTEVKEYCSKKMLCPYEVALMQARKARVIITDYNYLFNPGISKAFLQKIGKELSELILIVDEAHNLPDRVKDAASDKISTLSLKRAASEAEKYKYDEMIGVMKKLAELLERFGLTIDEGMEERFLEKEDFVRKVKEVMDVDELVATLERIGDVVREEQQYSYLGAIGDFLRTWIDGEDEGFARILSESRFRDEEMHQLSYRCLDPSVITADVLNNAHSSVLMSGTLSPTKMYKELVGALKAEELTLQSPFPEDNRLTLIIPKTSTKFTKRGDTMYQEIAEHCGRICNGVPGNSAVFFPSYALLNNILRYLEPKLQNTVFAERAGMSKDEKHEFLERFKKYKDSGAVLLGVITGNFGEGIDLPGDLLRCVVVVGLPLGKPDLETKALINYFDNKFGQGWEYGYTFPAFNRTLQSAGRCIRTEQDRGVLVFLDERYEWPRYKKCFPEDWTLKSTVLYEGMIKDFFKAERKNKELTDF
ncbi:ATP-dependent DNA helicase, partial [Candidatus Woesearchaeota archaeon]|nr:ATP-dependent DNA helicase [Candidatus Woesearchaeota archaeon]